ncbi:MAG TPA: L,D-transpeptidase family protein [Flavisolibacter sp.]|nr:L,D-transpeptidase family protein [Flavisolibacter sp.]
MKKFFCGVAVLSILISSCDNLSGFFKSESEHNAADSASNKMAAVVARDMSITPANAYSDLFLDSTTLEQYILQEKITDTLARDLRNFYNKRNYQYAWFVTQGMTEQGRSFWNLYDSKTDDVNYKADTTLDKRLDTLMTKDSLHIAATDSVFIKTELALTKEFIHYAKVNGQNNWQNLVPAKKIDAMQLADSLIKQNDTAQYATNRPYMKLREQLKRYHSIAQQGGWQPIALGAKVVKKGVSSPAISSIKKRLQLSGDYNSNDTTAQFNDSLEVAIKSVQERFGYKPTGIITDTLVNSLNIPVEQRIQQLLINMNRMAWMPAQNQDKIIEVNIPAFMLQALENNQKAFDMEVVVGKEGTNTMMFTGNLNQIVFSPSWNIPQSIVENEIMPAMKKDPNYLKKRNMEIVTQNGTIPQIRQLPGKENALGKVKFLFPNSYDIYFHDTPAKGLFEQENRAFSHGCIRLADATKMAQYLLRDQSEWTPEKIQQAMNSNKEQTVKLQKPVPVMINYYTAWVDDKGQVHFRNDIYKHDSVTAARMFTNSAPHMPVTNAKDSTKRV